MITGHQFRKNVQLVFNRQLSRSNTTLLWWCKKVKNRSWTHYHERSGQPRNTTEFKNTVILRSSLSKIQRVTRTLVTTNTMTDDSGNKY